MKLAGPHLLYFVVAGTLAAQPVQSTAPAPPAKTSARLTQEIRAVLPKFVITAATQSAGTEPAGPPDPNVVVLPTLKVQEKRAPGHDPDVWLTDRAIQQKAMAAYKGSMTDLEWALNSWFIPLFSAPASMRARSAYESDKARAEITRLHGLIERIADLNPKEAAKLRRGMDPRKLPKDD